MIEPLIGPVLADLGLSEMPVKILAVVGGAVLGGWSLAWLVYLFVRGTTAQKLPVRAVWVVRILGTVACGLMMYLWLFGGGGGLIGGSGGLGVRPGSEKGGSSATAEKDSPGQEKDSSATKTPPGKEKSRPVVLRVEVLGNDALRRVAKSDTFDAERRYRVDGRLRTLAEVKQALLAQLPPRAEETPGRVEVVVYNDSPASDRPLVTDLTDWARARADVETVKVEKDAPAE